MENKRGQALLLPRCSLSHTFTPSSSQLLLRYTASQSGEGGFGSKRMRETGKGFPLEIHQENEQKPCPKKSLTQTGSTSGPQPDLAHELGKGTRMSAWEVTARTPGWGLTRPLPGWRRQNGRWWKICVCSEPCAPRLRRRSSSPASRGLAPAGRREGPGQLPHGGRGLSAEAPLIRAGAERVRPGPTSGGTSQLCGR